MTLKTGVMMLKIQLCGTGINLILKYIRIENSYFELQKFINKIKNVNNKLNGKKKSHHYCFVFFCTVFLSNKCSLLLNNNVIHAYVR